MSLHDETFREIARRHLHRRDPEFRALIRIVGRFDLVPHKRRSPFESLARALSRISSSMHCGQHDSQAVLRVVD